MQSRKEIQLFVAGTNDGKLRRVEHIPLDGDNRSTQIINREKNFFGFVMLLHHEEGVKRTIIRQGRLVTKVIAPTGPLN